MAQCWELVAAAVAAVVEGEGVGPSSAEVEEPVVACTIVDCTSQWVAAAEAGTVAAVAVVVVEVEVIEEVEQVLELVANSSAEVAATRAVVEWVEEEAVGKGEQRARSKRCSFLDEAARNSRRVHEGEGVATSKRKPEQAVGSLPGE